MCLDEITDAVGLGLCCGGGDGGGVPAPHKRDPWASCSSWTKENWTTVGAQGRG